MREFERCEIQYLVYCPRPDNGNWMHGIRKGIGFETGMMRIG